MKARYVVAMLLGVIGWGAAASAADRHHDHGSSTGLPAEAGQSAFAAIAEIVTILEADPTTDWAEVDLSALREHLVDMNMLTLDAAADETPLDNGLAITVTGADRTRDALQRMVPAHAIELDRMPIWSAAAEAIADGARLTVTSADPLIQARIRALGFFGLMATGGHHQRHHLAIARGEPIHRHH